jgi:hypothetical protein
MGIVGQEECPEHFQSDAADHDKQKAPQLLRKRKLVGTVFRIERPHFVDGEIHNRT